MNESIPSHTQSEKIDEQLAKEVMELGFSRKQLLRAYIACGNKKDLIIEHLLNNPIYSMESEFSGVKMDAIANEYLRNVKTGDDKKVYDKEEEEFKKAVEISIKDQNMYYYEPLNPEQRTYFTLPQVVKKVLNFDDLSALGVTGDGNNSSLKDEEYMRRVNRKAASVRLLKELQNLFGRMIRSNKSYADPTLVLKHMVDPFGKTIQIGDQKDITEFNMNLIERIDEAFSPIKEMKTSEINLSEKPKELNESDSSEIEDEDGVIVLGVSNKVDINKELFQSQFIFKSKEEKKHSDIYDGFFGKVEETINYEKDKVNHSMHQGEAEFGPVIMNHQNKDLYSGWEGNLACDIEEFKTAEGNLSKAKVERWITKLPNVLMFQIQRVSYDTKKNKLSKTNEAFNFDKVIYADRFMAKNKDVSLKLRQKRAQLHSRVQLLEDSLRQFENFSKSGVSLTKILPLTVDFLNQQNNEDFVTVDTHKDDIITYYPNGIGYLGIGEDEVFKAIKTLLAYEKEVTKQIAAMNGQLLELKNQALEIYKDLKSHPFYLHSILVHDGNSADCGHYYAFIYDHFKQQWMRYNDISVTAETEENVMKESLGGAGCTSSAYCLVYADEYYRGFETRIEKKKLDDFILDECYMSVKPSESEKKDMNISTDKNNSFLLEYSKILKPKLKQKIDEENLEFLKELVEYQTTNIVREIQTLYKDRLDQIKKITTSKEIMVNKQLINFTVYLKEEKLDYLYRWHLLNCCMKELHPANLALTDAIDHDDPIIQKLQKIFLNVCPDAPKLLNLVGHDMETLRSMKERYLEYRKNGWIAEWVLRSSAEVEESKWCEAIFPVVAFHFERRMSGKSNLQRIPKDVTRVMGLRLTTLINQLLLGNKADKAMEYAYLCGEITISFLEREDSHYKQIFANLRNTQKFAAKLLTSEQHFELNRIINGISEKKLDWPKQTLSIIPQGFVKVMELEEQEDTNVWREMFDSETLAFKYPVALDLFNQKFKVQYPSKLQKWVEIHQKLLRGQLAEHAFYQMEKDMDIDIKAV